MVLTVRYGFNRFPNYTYEASQGFDLSSLGFSPTFVSQVPRQLAQFPSITMSNLYTLGGQDNNSFYVHASNNFSASVSKFAGTSQSDGGFRLPKDKSSRERRQ